MHTWNAHTGVYKNEKEDDLSRILVKKLLDHTQNYLNSSRKALKKVIERHSAGCYNADKSKAKDNIFTYDGV